MLFIKPSLRSVKLETKTKIDEKCKKKLYKKVTEPKQKKSMSFEIDNKNQKRKQKSCNTKGKSLLGNTSI